MKGNLYFKNDWASLLVGGKFAVFALFLFVFEGNSQVQAPWGAYIWRGDLTEGFLHYEFGGLIHGGAYFRNFTVVLFLFLPPIHDFLGAALSRASAICIFLVLLQCSIFIQHLIPSGKVLS